MPVEFIRQPDGLGQPLGRYSHVSVATGTEITTYLVGADNIPEFMAARTAAFAEFFADGAYPPNTLIVVARLVEDRFAVEVEAMAIRNAVRGH
jgi:enamine deaminase RidA (YjgF/YER057c/UK114 family)